MLEKKLLKEETLKKILQKSTKTQMYHKPIVKITTYTEEMKKARLLGHMARQWYNSIRMFVPPCRHVPPTRPSPRYIVSTAAVYPILEKLVCAGLREHCSCCPAGDDAPLQIACSPRQAGRQAGKQVMHTHTLRWLNRTHLSDYLQVHICCLACWVYTHTYAQTYTHTQTHTHTHTHTHTQHVCTCNSHTPQSINLSKERNIFIDK